MEEFKKMEKVLIESIGLEELNKISSDIASLLVKNRIDALPELAKDIFRYTLFKIKLEKLNF